MIYYDDDAHLYVK